ncbi:MAG: aminoacyl-tRNA hydrolase [Deltaproteobacteria bacterium]
MLIIGLGNPGTKYKNTRHNIGFMAVDYLSGANSIKCSNLDFNSQWGRGIICEREVILAKPQTFMNLSGKAVKALSGFFHKESEDIIVIYDDIDLDLGAIRIRAKGSSGGHRGMESIIEQLGTKNFPRIRLGIGRPRDERQEARGKRSEVDVAEYVLSPFSKEEKATLKQVLEMIKDAVDIIVKDGIEKAMNRFNKKTG